MRTNKAVKRNQVKNHAGGPGEITSPYQTLYRSVMACLLFENEFYEDGQSIADRIHELAQKVDPAKVQELAIEARTQMHLRHAPLWLICAIPSAPGIMHTIEKVINRPDELCELVAMFWKNGKRPLPAQIKKGLARAFTKFDRYQIAKYNRDHEITLRDVMFLVHPKPRNDEQKQAFSDLADEKLVEFETWEAKVSNEEDPSKSYTDLLKQGRMGYLSVLRNLRKMNNLGVDRELIKLAIVNRKGASRVLPFRYVAAYNNAPSFAKEISISAQASIRDMDQFDGETFILVDISGSMTNMLSEKSDLTRMDVACALAALFPGQARVWSFTDAIVEVPNEPGLGMIGRIKRSQVHGWTNLRMAVKCLNALNPHRFIVITDEQAQGIVPGPNCNRAYMINVASYKPAIGYGHWTKITGFSENIFRYIHAHEALSVERLVS